MPWPDFTELTFGFAYLREFEQLYVHGGKFPKAPDFISQGAEATKGYDVEIAMNNAVPVFIQLKRSKVMVQANAKEIDDPNCRFNSNPIFRMYLHKTKNFRQHKALQALEADGHDVRYVTSQIQTQAQFAQAYASQTIVSHASATFSPNSITLPNDIGEHWVSFRKNSAHMQVYSEKGIEYERTTPNFGRRIEELIAKRRSADENRDALKRAVKRLVMLSTELDGMEMRFAGGSMEGSSERELSILGSLGSYLQDRPVEEQASILAYFVLDAHLTFFKPN
jgi:hypothetical protein